MLQIALPNKGALSAGAVELIQAAGYHCRPAGRALSVRDCDNDIAFLFLRPRDIAIYVYNGVLDLGVTGRDMLLDSQTNLEELLTLGFGAARFYYAASRASGPGIADLHGARIATSYPHLVAQDLQRRGIEAKIVHLDGAVEISIQLGVADVIADVVQTGQTLEDAGLITVGEPLLATEAILVARSRAAAKADTVRLFMERLRGIIVAREYVMVEYDCPKTSLEAACVITPGIESPTVAPLSKTGWVAVKAMARRQETNHIMDALEHIGARGILVTDIRTCRI